MKRFRKPGIIAIALIMLVTLVGASMVLGQGYPGVMPHRSSGTPQPGGMMGGYGRGGMMNGNGFMPGYGMMGGYATNGTGQPVTSLDQAQQAVQTYVNHYGNSDLVIDEVMEFQQNFYAIVKEHSTGIGAFEVLVNKQTGAVFPEYGPDMMWNTKYGMMQWGNTTAPPMTVSADQATRLAADWLAQNQSGATTEPPDAFYGYYTLHITKDGTVTGMLSVNGYSGQVWYHTWHGAFIGMKDLHA
jgi:hypothetical protein